MIGTLGTGRPEAKRDLEKPFADGSGYEYEKDENGDYVSTGRTEHWFQVAVEMDMCKIYDSALNVVHTKYKDKPLLDKDHFAFVYMKDGNSEFKEDAYGDPLVVVPFNEVFDAVETDMVMEEYRRFKWLYHLMDAMREDSEKLVCVFYGD